jgi:hypothetical protein
MNLARSQRAAGREGFQAGTQRSGAGTGSARRAERVPRVPTSGGPISEGTGVDPVGIGSSPDSRPARWLSQAWITRLLVMAFVLLLLPSAGRALDFGFGPRLGLSRSEDGLELGAKFVLADFGIDLVQPLRFAASGSYGFGTTGAAAHFTAWHLNGCLEYVLLNPTRVLQVYPILGVAAYRLKADGCVADAADCGAWRLGGNVGGGILYRSLSVDAMLGIGSLPTLTISASLTFGL